MLNNFADELKQVRLSKNISLQQLAVRTKIDYKFLEAMENGDFEFLPELYVKSFVKEYIRILELDEDIYIKKYEAAKAGKVFEEQKVEEVKELPREKPAGHTPRHNVTAFDLVRKFKMREEEVSVQKRKIKILAYIIAGTLIVTGAVYLLIFKDSDNIIVPEKSWEEIVQDTKDRYNEEGNGENITVTPVSADSLKLVIRATDTTWIRLVLDDSRTEEFILFPGSQKSMKTADNYRITFGNSGGVQLQLNDKPLLFPGKKSSVTTVQIDSSGIKGLDDKTVIK